ncbi:hypothetical protein HPQ64_08300 [Rhizobiales bacterium]|uniref:DUF6665 family protein n=1 Tax=Hongsoonwoonella zoysiae TaxID=2821844 RepID=UPI00156121A7|nr:DUF6665 family protein [Hongsoonwoonella zoysiae]NRG17687.1 hypothetical protein [Hongsoonwoonella zoysiae]
MSVRPPRQFTASEKDPLAKALEQEVMSEKADTLARLMTKLEKALARLAAHEERIAQAQAANAEPPDPARRQRLIAEAGEALWHVIIQRELCGLHRHDGLMREMSVPKRVRLSMGPASLRNA